MPLNETMCQAFEEIRTKRRDLKNKGALTYREAAYTRSVSRKIANTYIEMGIFP